MRISTGIGLVLVFLGACGGGPTAPESEIYSLDSVNGNPLPARLPGSDVIEIVEGSLTLSPDGTVVDRTRVSCRDDLPSGTQCNVVNGGRSERTGSYDRAAAWMEFDGTRIGARFEPGRITVTPVPPSMGIPTVTLVYLR